MKSLRRIVILCINISLPIIGGLMVFFYGLKLAAFFSPFVIGYMISLMAYPLVSFLERRIKLKRKFGSALIVILAIVLVLFILYLLISRAALLFRYILALIPGIYDTAGPELEAFSRSAAAYARHLPLWMQKPVEDFLGNLNQHIDSAVEALASPTLETAQILVKSIPAALVSLVITLLSSYIFIVDREKIRNKIHSLIPAHIARYGEYARRDLKRLIYGYFLAQFRIMFVIMVVMTVGLLLLGVRHAILLALFISLLDFLPIFGTGTVLFPWAIIKLINGDIRYALGLILIYVVTQVIRQIIQPKIVGDSVGMSPMLTLLCLYIGFQLRGLGGMLLAVPVRMVLLKLYEYGIFDSFVRNIKRLLRELKSLGDF